MLRDKSIPMKLCAFVLMDVNRHIVLLSCMFTFEFIS